MRLLLIFFLASLGCFSQTDTLYTQTSKLHLVTRNFDKEESYVLLFGDEETKSLNDFSFMTFNNSSHLRAFLSLTIRSINQRRLVNWKTEYETITVYGVTKNTANVSLNDKEYYMDRMQILNILRSIDEQDD